MRRVEGDLLEGLLARLRGLALRRTGGPRRHLQDARDQIADIQPRPFFNEWLDPSQKPIA